MEMKTANRIKQKSIKSHFTYATPLHFESETTRSEN